MNELTLKLLFSLSRYPPKYPLLYPSGTKLTPQVKTFLASCLTLTFINNSILQFKPCASWNFQFKPRNVFIPKLFIKPLYGSYLRVLYLPILDPPYWQWSKTSFFC